MGGDRLLVSVRRIAERGADAIGYFLAPNATNKIGRG
jgi:hypothetical protein